MASLLLVSNRLPVTVERKGANLAFVPSVGGLATGLRSLHARRDSLWAGWSGLTTDSLKPAEAAAVRAALRRDHRCLAVGLSRRDLDAYYNGFCNKTVWPLFHGFPTYTAYDHTQWEAYRRVNLHFRKVLAGVLEPHDTVWIHDYQLMLLPALLRETQPALSIGFFLHIPFPAPELFLHLPWRRAIMEGLLGADLIGFHTFDYVHSFIECAIRLTDVQYRRGHLMHGSRPLRADCFPMGIDFEHWAAAAGRPEVRREIEKLTRRIGGRRVVLSVERLDYTKGILNRLEAFHRFLERNPAYENRVVLIQVTVPSRSKVEDYVRLKRRVDEAVGRINGRFGAIGWMPIWYLHRALPFEQLAALYAVSDVNLVTPLKDGMNLIAKEYVAANPGRRGVLVLSERAGVAHELGEVLLVNPNDTDGMATTLLKAFEMPEAEQAERLRAMKARLSKYSLERWSREFLEQLNRIKRRQQRLKTDPMTPRERGALQRAWATARTRLVLLDYDGTLAPIAERPEQAAPGPALLGMLDTLARCDSTRVVIVSGRTRDTLDAWFQGLEVWLVAEHGAWLRARGGTWGPTMPLRSEWKSEIRPILELFVDRTPGTFIEEKTFSLAWHYRAAAPNLEPRRAGELKQALFHLASSLGLAVLEGRRVIEVKNAGIHKGVAAGLMVSDQAWDFILAAGDDWTDEDLFEALPASAFTIKVGRQPSWARHHIESPEACLRLLEALARAGSATPAAS